MQNDIHDETVKWEPQDDILYNCGEFYSSVHIAQRPIRFNFFLVVSKRRDRNQLASSRLSHKKLIICLELENRIIKPSQKLSFTYLSWFSKHWLSCDSFDAQRRTTEDSSSRGIKRLVPVFIPETKNQSEKTNVCPGSSRRLMRPLV